MLLLAEAAELISGNNQAYSVQPDIAGKSGPFISGGRTRLVFKKGKCNKNNVFQPPPPPPLSPPARSMHMFVESEDWGASRAGGNIDR